MQSEMSSTGTTMTFGIVLQVVDVGRTRSPRTSACRRAATMSVDRRVGAHEDLLPASKYCDEKEICSQRSQLTVITSATMSTRTVQQRRDALRVRDHLVLDARCGSPKIACATSRTRSMSKPSRLTGQRVAVAEQQRVGRDAGDQPPALLDDVHVAARRHVARRRHRVQTARTTPPGCRSRAPAARPSSPAWPVRPWSAPRRPAGCCRSQHAVATARDGDQARDERAGPRRALIGTPAVVAPRLARPATAAAQPARAGASQATGRGSARVVEVVGQVALPRSPAPAPTRRSNSANAVLAGARRRWRRPPPRRACRRRRGRAASRAPRGTGRSASPASLGARRIRDAQRRTGRPMPSPTRCLEPLLERPRPSRGRSA